MAIDPFLDGLPAPRVIEELSFEAILQDMKTDLSVRFPEIAPVLALESSAAVKILQTCAYRELGLRVRANDASRANLLAYATGSDLDHVGANASPPVARMFEETDDRFRQRILLATRARNVGSYARFKLIAMNTSLMVRDAIAYRNPANPRDPTVYVSLLSTDPSGVAPQAVIDAVEAAFDQPEDRIVNSEVVVVSAVTSVVNVAATLTLTPGTPPNIIAAIETGLRAAWNIEGGLGRDLTRDWLRARIMVPGVYSAVIASPATDVIKPPVEAVSIGTVTLSVAGENN